LPATGKLDAFVWRRPHERLSAGGEAEEAIFRPVSGPAAEPPALIEKPRMAIAPPEPEKQAGPGPAPAGSTAASREMTTEVSSAGAPLPENEPGRPMGSMAPPDSGPDEQSKPHDLRPLF